MTEQEWLDCTDPTPMLPFLFLSKWPSDRKLRLFAVATCRRIEHLFVHKVLRNALEVAEQFADGLVSRVHLDEAHRAATVAAGGFSEAIIAACTPTDPLCPECGAAMKLRQGRRGFFHGCSTYPRCRGTCSSLLSAADAAARSAAEKAADQHTAEWELARTSETSQQSHLMRDLFGNPFQHVSIDPAWLAWNDGTVVKLAHAIYADRAFDRLPILADALEDAGCEDAEILDHCRGPGPHTRGCWVTDLLTGRS